MFNDKNILKNTINIYTYILYIFIILLIISSLVFLAVS